MMGYASKFVHMYRLTLTPISISRFNHLFFFTSSSNKFKLVSVKTQLKNAFLQQRPNLVLLQSPSLNVSAKILHSSRFSGRYLSSQIILGASIASVSASAIAHAMDAGDALVDDHSNDSLDTEDDENVQHLWKLARKFWLPVFFFLTVLANLDDPIMILFIKVTLFLLSTKPNPFSVYVLVDQLCQRSMRQDTRFFRVQLYASKVEVQDYKLLCMASVEIKDEKFTLVGILGTWWTLPHLPFREAFSFVRSRLGSILVITTEKRNHMLI